MKIKIINKSNFYYRVRIFAILSVFMMLAVFFVPATSHAAVGDFCSNGVVSVPCFFEPDQGFAGADSFGGLVLTILQLLLLVVGSLSVLFLMIGGIRYVTAHGNEENAEAAKKTMTHAIIGLVIVVMSFAIITIITNVLVKGDI